MTMVSIPHRHATNKCETISGCGGFPGFPFLIGTLRTRDPGVEVDLGGAVSIPHRHATNWHGFDVRLGRVAGVSIPHRHATNQGHVRHGPHPCDGFPFLIGTLRTADFRAIHGAIREVSIPHRHATNPCMNSILRPFGMVSIPHRHATNSPFAVSALAEIASVSIPHRHATNRPCEPPPPRPAAQFPFLIGTLRTCLRCPHWLVC